MSNDAGRLLIPAAVVGGAVAAPYVIGALGAAGSVGGAAEGTLGAAEALTGGGPAGLAGPTGFWPALGTAIKTDLARAKPSEILANTATAAYGGSVVGDVLGLNQPHEPFQMGTVQAPSPVVSPGGGFRPTSDAAMQALMNAMAQRRAAQGRIRFV